MYFYCPNMQTSCNHYDTKGNGYLLPQKRHRLSHSIVHVHVLVMLGLFHKPFEYFTNYPNHRLSSCACHTVRTTDISTIRVISRSH